jgi:hypothetical protein
MGDFKDRLRKLGLFNYWGSPVANRSQHWNPRVKVYMAAPFIFNDSQDVQNNAIYRRRNAVLRSMYRAVDFDKELDQFLLNSGHLDPDMHYRGVARKMASMIIVNMLCG